MTQHSCDQCKDNESAEESGYKNKHCPFVPDAIMQDETETCMWLAEFGDVCGFGYTPEDAYLNFDKVWSCP